MCIRVWAPCSKWITLTLTSLLSSVRPWRETFSAPWKNLVARLMLWRGTSDSFETFIGVLRDGIANQLACGRGLFQGAQSDPAQAQLAIIQPALRNARDSRCQNG